MLGVFGDSFSTTNIMFGGWPNDLSNLLKIRLANYSYPGTSLWYSYSKFIENYKKYSHIVFCYTNQHRWLTLPEHLKGWHWIVSDYYLDRALGMSDEDRKTMKKIVDVHQYFLDEELNNFVYQSIFDNVNRICAENNIKIFNVLPFESMHVRHYMNYSDRTVDVGNRNIDFKHKSGPCLLGVMALSEAETKTAKTDKKINYINTVSDIRGCHLNITNNKLVAKIIYDNFVGDANDDVIDILDRNYNADPDELKQMIDKATANENRK